MANIGLICYRVYNSVSNEYMTTAGFENDFFDKDLIEKFAGAPKTVTKLGVLAPPGTHFILNKTKEIMIGRTGVYELDENVNITSVMFEQPKSYVKDVEKSDKAVSDGKIAMENAENTKFETLLKAGLIMSDGTVKPVSDINNQDELDNYLTACNKYNVAYNDGYDLYRLGILGYYKESDEPEGLKNVIIDFIYE